MNSKYVKVKKTGNLDIPGEPDPLAEPGEIIIVASPCPGWEPIKVPIDATSQVHCLICGQAFALE